MLKKTPNCPLNLVNSEKQEKNTLKAKNLLGFQINKNRLYFLRYREGYYHITILPIISQNQENGGFNTQKSVTAKK